MTGCHITTVNVFDTKYDIDYHSFLQMDLLWYIGCKRYNTRRATNFNVTSSLSKSMYAQTYNRLAAMNGDESNCEMKFTEHQTNPVKIHTYRYFHNIIHFINVLSDRYEQ